MARDKVAVLGPAGTYTEAAAKKILPKAELVYYDSVEEVFEAVSSGTKHGVVAIENSLEGSVNSTLDCLMKHDLAICGEVVLGIDLCLAAPKKAGEKDIKTVVSHPHALAQCRGFLKKHLPAARSRGAESTASAMKEASKKKGTAAVGPREAAKTYGLSILYEGIQDEPSQTRFIVICKTLGEGSKTSIIFSTKDKPGALYEALGEFAKRGINLTKIESRPSKKKLGEYLFYVDFKGSPKQRKIEELLSSLKAKTTYLKILGSY